jgi:branched-chain amino acid transport system substrate-binding protein
VLGLIGPYTSGVSKEAIPVANAADLAMIGPATTYWCLTRAAPYCDPQPFCAGRSGCTVDFFRIAPPDPIQGRAMARYAAANLPVSRVAAINELEGEGDQHIVEFASEFARTGGQVVLQQDFMAGTTNFTGFLQTAKTRGAQAVYVVGLGTDRICTVRAQMSRLLPEAYFIAADGVMDGGTLCVQDAIDPVHMLATYPDFIPTYSQDPSVKKQVDAYRRDHRKPSDVTYYTFTAYDATRILIDAIGRAIQSNHGAFPTRAQVVSAVAQTRDFKGVTGTYSFDTNGDTVSPPMSLYEARNNDWFFVKQLDASPARS